MDILINSMTSNGIKKRKEKKKEVIRPIITYF